jgi:hypothetical protein
MWLFLQSGWANTAAIAAFALLPFVSLAGSALDTHSTQARTRPVAAELEQVARQPQHNLEISVE